MRYSKDHKSETRARIVDGAGRRFREEGIDAVGVASLMGSVGLTHGGFYAHFGSKEELVAEVCTDAFNVTLDDLKRRMRGAAPGKRVATLVNAYLSETHRDRPGDGCVVAALGSEVGRHAAPVRAAYTARLHRMVELVEEALRGDGASVAAAGGIVATMVGALTLARAVDDPQWSSTLLRQARRLARNAAVPSESG